MACAHAELGDETAVVVSLNTSFEKFEIKPFDLLPDPLEVSSFEAMKENSDFRKIAKEREKVLSNLRRLTLE